ncbi:unnamed protein product [Cuscuta epithymum]|uniref:Uncharacterized protein n=1 Tax=Cuscuta epithymum TaxID=186058 RepID=A0AAV0CMC9_9ASTE|nr:unnamed protein product [Cuscuta epithymum]
MEPLVESEEKAREGTGVHGEQMNIDKHGASSSLEGSQTIEPEKTEWTNEKHSKYLSSMETSFVNQLYDSLESFGWHSRNKCSSDHKISKQKHSTCGQFKIFQDGNWTKIDVSRGESMSPRLNRREGTGLFLTNPWIKHYRLVRHHVGTSSNTQEEIHVPVGMTSCHPGAQFDLHQESNDSITEVTDQNFVDDDLEASSKTSLRMKSMKGR